MSYSKQSTVPIEFLPGIGRRTAKVLHKLEIKTIGQFKQMPEQVLIELFGPSIKTVYYKTNNIKKITVPKKNKNIYQKIKMIPAFLSLL